MRRFIAFMQLYQTYNKEEKTFESHGNKINLKFTLNNHCNCINMFTTHSKTKDKEHYLFDQLNKSVD